MKEMYNETIMSYLATLTLTHRGLVLIFLSYKNCQPINLHREELAKRLGCTVRTVSRAIARLRADGFIIRRVYNPFAPYSFLLNDNFIEDYKKVLQGQMSIDD